MKLSEMNNSVTPSNIKTVYEFLLKNSKFLPIKDALRLFWNLGSPLFERIHVIYMKGRSMDDINEEPEEIGNDEDEEYANSASY